MKNKRIEELEDVIGFNVYDLIPNDKDDYDVADIVLTIGERNGLNDYDEAIDYIRYNPKIFDEYLNDGYLENCKSLLQMINFIYLCELTSYYPNKKVIPTYMSRQRERLRRNQFFIAGS